MKKIGIYIIPLLALGVLTSCEEDPFKGIPQENPQGPVMDVNSVEIDCKVGESVDLNSYVDQMIPVISLVNAGELPEEANVSFQMQLASQSDYSDARTFDVVDGSVSANEWSDAFRAMLGRSPKPKTNYIRFIAYATIGDDVYRLGEGSTFYGTKSVTVTPIDLGIVVEPAYYLIGTCCDWTPVIAASDYKFSHSGADVYDDPVFTINVEISEEQAVGGWWWKIAPQSSVDQLTVPDGNFWTGIFGLETDGDSALSGYLTNKGDAGAGCIYTAGKYKLTINMEEGSYLFEDNSALYAVGDGSSWGFDTAMMLYPWADAFAGFIYVESMVKFTTAPDWNHGDYGMGETEGSLAEKGGNISVSAPGLYYATVDISAMTYSLTPITSISLIGDFNSWGGDVELTPNVDYKVWTGTLTLENDSSWKFRMNNDWNINLGGVTPNETGNLVQNGENMFNTAGTYTITLDLSTLPYTCTVQ